MKKSHSEIKKEELDRCDRFIEAANAYNGSFQSIRNMRDHLIDYLEEYENRYWEDTRYCSYCKEFWNDKDGCYICPLGGKCESLRDVKSTCCEGLEQKIMKSKSKNEFTDNLKRYRNYVEKNG